VNTLSPTAYIRALLAPLVRWCLKRGVRSSQVEEILRESFVHEAQHEIEDAQGAFSVSKVSVMTGLHRTEVSRLLAGDRPDRGAHNILNRVLGLWASSARYRSAQGVPRDLTHEGLSSEFARLVAAVSKEVTHYPILFELERIGAIEYVNNLVRLKVQEYTPREDQEYGLELLSLDIADLASAIEANVTNRYETPSLHLRTAYDNIDPNDLPEIRTWILNEGAQFQSRMREYLAQFDRDSSGIGEHHGERARVTVTNFSYAEAIQAPKAIVPRKRGRKRCTPQ
jgi:hypothetical protein